MQCAVLQPKGIELDPRVSVFVVPRIAIDSLVLMRSDTVPVTTLLGLRVAIPSFGRSDTWTLESFIPEEFYSTQFILFGNWIVRIGDRLFPYVLTGFLHQVPYTGFVPLQQVKNEESCIFVPPNFAQCEVRPFTRLDSVIPELADQRFAARTASRSGVAFGLGAQYFPTGQETVSVIGDYRIVHWGQTVSTPIDTELHPTVLPAKRTDITTQFMRLSITLLGDNYFSLFTVQMNVSNIDTQMRLGVCFGTAL